MRWKNADKTSWHKWFAWYPVTIDGNEKVWLETVERQATWSQVGLGEIEFIYREFIYRNIENDTDSAA
jgi:hypothetical protein